MADIVFAPFNLGIRTSARGTRVTYMTADFGTVEVIDKHNAIRATPGGSFRFDTASDFTTVPISMANSYDIAWDKSDPIHVKGVTGTGKGYLGSLWYSFPEIDELAFEIPCLFSSTIQRAVISLETMTRSFEIAVGMRKKFPDGAFWFILKKNHFGKKRKPRRR